MSEFDVKTLKGITQDSRKVQPGYLFAALPGAKVDGRDFIPQAIEAGASAILALRGTQVPEGIHLIEAEEPRLALAKLAAIFYGVQPKRIVAVTGTNGKTSTVHFVQQVWQALGINGASLGTLGVRRTGGGHSGSMTTPDPVTLHEELKALADGGVTHLAMEASSHGLDQYRLDGVRVQVAAFTNLSRDHLDYHEGMEAYFAAKARLFTELLAADGMAVLNADVEQYGVLHSATKERGDISFLSYGEKGEEIKLISAVPSPHGQDIQIEVLGKSYAFTLPLVGGFQLMNVLCALGMVISEFLEDAAKIEAAIEALSSLQGVPGRLQRVSNAPVYVDYAHTPDALETVLKALRPHTAGRLVCLFGCGGDRDKGKRPMMAKVAAAFADEVIVTDDNPRSEDPAVIRADVMVGAPDVKEIPGRRAAIAAAVEELREGDVLLVAGKGHEQGQIFADYTEAFDDYEEAENALKERVSA